jgi:hypothetical protein
VGDDAEAVYALQVLSSSIALCDWMDGPARAVLADIQRDQPIAWLKLLALGDRATFMATYEESPFDR